MQQLLKSRADVNMQKEKYSTALQTASIKNHDQIMQQLLKSRADVNMQKEHYSIMLQTVSANDHDQIVK